MGSSPYLDHMNHVVAIRIGKAYCLNSAGKHVDIWKTKWKRIDQLGVADENLRIHWVKSHQKAGSQETHEGKINRIGNEDADAFANEEQKRPDIPVDFESKVAALRKYVKEFTTTSAAMISSSVERRKHVGP